MSVDLSNPEIARIKGELLDPSSSTQWCLVHYDPSSTSPALSLVASGQEPVIPQWKEQLAKLREHGDGVAFGYGDFKGKGCILHYLNDSIAGVKRARAVVHSRAFAQLFPDYSALITISHPDQLTDTLINEKLGLDYHVQRVPSNRPSPAQETATQGDHEGSERIVSSTVKDELPPVPPAMMLGRPVHQPVSTSDTTSASNRQPSSSVPEAAARYPTEVLSISQPQSREVSGAGGPRLASAQQSRQTSGTGGDHPQESHVDRHRKVSLTTRLGRAFGNPAMQERASENSSEASASSPSGSSKLKSSFSKAFKRTSGGTSPLTSPRTDTHDGPPVPPKDDYPVRPVLGNQESGDSGRFRTVSGGLGYKPPAPQAEPTVPLASTQIYDQQPAQNGQSSRAAAFPAPVSSRLYTPTSNQSHISPSPSAKRVMAEARIKSITQEEEIQNRFRRELHLDDRGAGAREVVVTQDDSDDDDDVRLPYDTSDHSVTDHLKGDDPADQPTADVVGAAEPQSRSIADDRPSDNDAQQPEPTSSSVQESAGRHLASDLQQQTDQLSAVEQAAEARRVQDAAEHEAHRLQMEADREAETAARRLQQEAEEFAEREEARRIQVQGEQAARDAEARRIQEEEEESRRKLEEEEKLRIALEEQKRIEEQRLREEEERARQEEVRRVEEEKQATERARKDSIKQSLLEGKQKGGIMLRGHVTVQTMKSPTWRRRLFQLLPGELRLYKNDSDENPIQTIHLGPGASLVHTYEESQVQGSWKIVSSSAHGSEEFFVFADSTEEKETILEGLQMAIV